jgi:hypothetical protein
MLSIKLLRMFGAYAQARNGLASIWTFLTVEHVENVARGMAGREYDFIGVNHIAVLRYNALDFITLYENIIDTGFEQHLAADAR